jgi:hypothetical protein
MTPATFADFLDGLSRAMGLPVAPTVSTRRVSLPAAPAQAMLAADPDVNLDAAVAVMYEAGELHDTDTPATSTRVRGRGVGITFSERRQSEPPAGHGRVVFTERERAAVTDVNNLLSIYPRPTVDEACEQVAPRYDVKPNTVKGWRKAMLRAAREAQAEAA